MTLGEWATKNGIVGREWIPRLDAYAFGLVTGEQILVDGHDFYSITKQAVGVLHEENAIAQLVRERWLELQHQHFEAAHARGGYC